MSTKYKVAVSDTVLITVEGKTTDGSGKPSPFKFYLVCKRLSAAALTTELENKEETAVHLLSKIVTDWRDQRLVLEQDDSPAAFSAEALEALLDIAGMPLQCLSAYLKDVGAKAKN